LLKSAYEPQGRANGFELMRKLIKVELSNEETILAYMGRVTARTVCLDCGEEVSTFSRDQASSWRGYRCLALSV
jgi:hypothetical protein